MTAVGILIALAALGMPPAETSAPARVNARVNAAHERAGWKTTGSVMVSELLAQPESGERVRVVSCSLALHGDDRAGSSLAMIDTVAADGRKALSAVAGVGHRPGPSGYYRWTVTIEPRAGLTWAEVQDSNDITVAETVE